MQGNQVGFESSLQQHLDTEQRRAVLEAIGGSINPDSTLGEIIDAAEALGWSEKMGDLSLADLAEALLAPNGESATVSEAAAADDDGDDEADEDEADEDDDEGEGDDEDDDDFELEIEEPAPSRRKPGKAAAAAAAKEAKSAATKKKITAASKKAASKKAAEPEPMRGKKTSKKAPQPEPARGKKSAKKLPEPEPVRGRKSAEKTASPAASKKTAKKAAAASAGRRKPTAVDVDDRMSLDEASDFFLPVVEELGEATMQALEEQTGVSRRKLRFHVGQLVKHGYLERHGMGRGTYYTRR